MVDVNILQTLPLIAADGRCSIIICLYVLYTVRGMRNGYKVLAEILKGRDYKGD
jgi:hypothetical protein